jgi:hypothetical protein
MNEGGSFGINTSVSRPAPRWPWVSLALGVVMLALALWPEDDATQRASVTRGGIALVGERPPSAGIEGELGPPSISGRPPRPPERAAPRSTPALPQASADEPADPPAPSATPDEAFTRPPPPPMLPIWAYPGAVDGPTGAPTRIVRHFDPTAPERAVQRALRQRDAKIGMDLPGVGRIATLLAIAVRQRTPPVSVGVFDAYVASDGEVIAISVRTFSGGDHAAWSGAAADAMAWLAGVSLPLPGHLAGGARVTVRVTQDTELPSGKGRKKRTRKLPEKNPAWKYVPRPGRHSRREEPIRSVKDNLPPDMQGLGDPETMMPPCSADGTGCNYIGYDLVDIGASKQRVVRTYISVNPARATRGPRK